MDECGYEKELCENTHEADTVCTGCKGMGKLTTMKLVGVEPEEYVCVFKCLKCGEKSVNFFDRTYDKRGCIRIECEFSNSDDLQREVNLNQSASVRIVSDDFSYEYESSTPGVYTVESLLRQAEDEMKKMCGKEDTTSDSGEKIVGEANTPGDECKKQLKKIEEMLRSPRFSMVVEDRFGLSRVAPVGKGVFELQNADVGDFDDGKVKHIFRSGK